MSLESYKETFLQAALRGRCLRLGTFELKSKRISPYFFNAGDFYRADLLSALATAYAHTIHAQFASSSATDLQFDVIFGPAYKGIPLATAATLALSQLDPARYGAVEYSGRRVLIIDDVVSAGTAKRQAIDKIRAEGGVVAGIVVALDRQETLPDSQGSAIGELRREYDIPIVAILNLEDIIHGLKSGAFATEDQLKAIEEYRAKYGASD
ncbi:Orotate phosphoribosyltransferase [Apiospora kogelbergensis]|uniref:Orotate phosphoribosyltransferase n=1 Tax=Apiospora kogelbergensis TaxID=1337665 RepID=UPI003131EFC9